MTLDEQLVVDDVMLPLADDEPASLTAARQLAEESRAMRRLRRGLPQRRPGASSARQSLPATARSPTRPVEHS